ncbi:MAG: hypothetical protein AUJ70_01755 [Candidatus Omnitrophica bacterium CG1_02_40_15]|nr:MAG: hypothetical protein AUJ70_01755 [Candidatus Omnitrophica bacterium CG1_02_40_15]
MTQKKPGLFKLLEIIIIILVSVLIITNLMYIKDACSSKQCVMTNVLTIILLVWATTFWLVVIKYSDKKK